MLRIKSVTLPLKTLFGLLMLIISLGSNAQLRYGFRFGGDFASASLKKAGEYSLVNRSGFTGGLVLEYQFPKNGLAPDIALLYNRYNTRLKPEGESPFSFGRNFIDIPLHIKYKFWIKTTHYLFAPMIYAGPSLSFRLDHNNSRPLETKKVQPGLDVGLGFDAVNFFQITGGYRFGLGNAVKNFSGWPEADLHTNGWNVSVTLLFDF